MIRHHLRSAPRGSSTTAAQAARRSLSRPESTSPSSSSPGRAPTRIGLQEVQGTLALAPVLPRSYALFHLTCRGSTVPSWRLAEYPD